MLPNVPAESSENHVVYLAGASGDQSFIFRVSRRSSAAWVFWALEGSVVAVSAGVCSRETERPAPQVVVRDVW